MLNPSHLCVGIDVAKAHLDVAIYGSDQRWQVSNDSVGFATLSALLRPLAPALVVVEASGGYERKAVCALELGGLSVAIVSPRRVRSFARANGRLAKTDRLDAYNLAHFAQAVRPRAQPLPSEQRLHLAALVSRRRQVVDTLLAEKNRRRLIHLDLRPRLEAHIAWLKSEQKALEADMSASGVKVRKASG